MYKNRGSRRERHELCVSIQLKMREKKLTSTIIEKGNVFLRAQCMKINNVTHISLSLCALTLLVSDRGHLKSCHTGCNVTLKLVSTCLFINYIVWSFDMANGDDGNGKSMNVIAHSAYRQPMSIW